MFCRKWNVDFLYCLNLLPQMENIQYYPSALGAAKHNNEYGKHDKTQSEIIAFKHF